MEAALQLEEAGEGGGEHGTRRCGDARRLAHGSDPLEGLGGRLGSKQAREAARGELGEGMRRRTLEEIEVVRRRDSDANAGAGDLGQAEVRPRLRGVEGQRALEAALRRRHVGGVVEGKPSCLRQVGGALGMLGALRGRTERGFGNGPSTEGARA